MDVKLQLLFSEALEEDLKDFYFMKDIKDYRCRVNTVYDNEENPSYEVVVAITWSDDVERVSKANLGFLDYYDYKDFVRFATAHMYVHEFMWKQHDEWRCANKEGDEHND